MSAAYSIETHSPEETAALGAAAASADPVGLVLCLRGELGAGKTVFVRGLVAALLGDVAVTSPTYVLQHVYRGPRLTVYHVDLYRLVAGSADFEGAGLGECFLDPQGVVCIEWAERMAGFLPGDRVEVDFFHAGPQVRRVQIAGEGDRAARFLERLNGHIVRR